MPIGIPLVFYFLASLGSRLTILSKITPFPITIVMFLDPQCMTIWNSVWWDKGIGSMHVGEVLKLLKKVSACMLTFLSR